jgi:hypothetical protein
MFLFQNFYNRKLKNFSSKTYWKVLRFMRLEKVAGILKYFYRNSPTQQSSSTVPNLNTYRLTVVNREG